MKKRIFIFGLFFTIVFLFSNISISTSAKIKDDEDLGFIEGAKSGILMELSTGEILYKKDIDKRLAPASMTKIMTLLLIFEGIENNVISYDTILTVSKSAESMGGSQVYLQENEKISVDEAIKCVCICSANDCAVLLAEAISGSEEAFVRKMNRKANDMGLKNTLFSDCTGLSSQNHYSSSHDMAIMSKELIDKYPKVLEYTNIREDYIRKNTNSPFWLVNTNKLIGRVDGVLGLKTGYCSFSGYNITLLMKKDNMSLISVVFGYSDSTKRNSESLELLRYGFNTYELKTILKKDEILETIESPCYRYPINIRVKDDINILVKKGNKENSSYDYEYNIENNLLSGSISLNFGARNVTGKIYTDSIIEKRNILDLLKYSFKRCFC